MSPICSDLEYFHLGNRIIRQSSVKQLQSLNLYRVVKAKPVRLYYLKYFVMASRV